MLVVQCISCASSLGHLENSVELMLRSGKSTSETMRAIEIHNLCCQRHIVACLPLSETPTTATTSQVTEPIYCRKALIRKWTPNVILAGYQLGIWEQGTKNESKLARRPMKCSGRWGLQACAVELILFVTQKPWQRHFLLWQIKNHQPWREDHWR